MQHRDIRGNGKFPQHLSVCNLGNYYGFPYQVNNQFNDQWVINILLAILRQNRWLHNNTIQLLMLWQVLMSKCRTVITLQLANNLEKKSSWSRYKILLRAVRYFWSSSVTERRKKLTKSIFYCNLPCANFRGLKLIKVKSR